MYNRIILYTDCDLPKIILEKTFNVLIISLHIQQGFILANITNEIFNKILTTIFFTAD